MSSSTSHAIKHRTNPKDVFITPRKLAKLHIDMIPDEYKKGSRYIWLDPCKNDGSYFDQFPTEIYSKSYCEILEGKDFFRERIPNWEVIISNPPWSCVDKWLEHTIYLEPQCFSYLLAQHAITPRRLEMIEKAGYTITRLHLTKVYQWYGMSQIIVCEKNDGCAYDYPQQITYDRTVWREDPKPKPALKLNVKVNIRYHQVNQR